MAEAVSCYAFTAAAGARPCEVADPDAVRWVPHHALGDGGLAGVAVTAGPMVPGRGCAARHRIEAALGFVDELLRHGCPLLLTVPLAVNDLADPVVVSRLEDWSRARGGAHGLVGFEIAAVDEGTSVPWGRIADLGYEMTLASAELLARWSPGQRAGRIAVGSALARRAPRDRAAAAEILDLAERAQAVGGGLLFRGDLTVEVEAWLGEVLRVPALRQPDVIGVARRAGDLAAQVRDLVRRRDAPVGPARGGGPRVLHDLTWVEVV